MSHPIPETALSVTQINLGDMDTYLRPDLPGIFRKLRLEAPVSWHQHPDAGKRGFWAVTRYDDIVATSKDTATFSNREGIQIIFEGDLPHAGQGSMIEMDPPEHARMRRLVGPAFSSMGVTRMHDQIQDRARAILDGLAGQDEIDFVRDFATPLPLGVFYDLMGVPTSDQRRMLELADRTFFSGDPRFGGDTQGIGEAGLEIQAYGRWLAEQRRKDPKRDVMSTLVQSTIDGQALSDKELGAFFGLLGAAGADTTRSSLSYALSALSDFPQQKALWLTDIDGRAAAATEEIVRWASPTMNMRRTATRDTELAGQKIAQGDKVALFYASGNFDELRFEAPWEFRIDRTPNLHMAFGLGGPHFCLGAHLAKLEIRIAYTELLKRYPDIEATGPAQRLRSNFINAPHTLQARLGRAR
jgi:cytochrome P450